MKYVGLQSQIWKNNLRSITLLLMFPTVIIAMLWLFLFLLLKVSTEEGTPVDFVELHDIFVSAIPAVLIGVTIWFLIAWFMHTGLINRATHAVPLQRKDNMRVYNLLENLCMSRGIPMPKLQVIEDNSLNAYASGISQKSYTITLSRGIINTLSDDELEGVIAHELTHIMNRDVRLLIVSIIFVGIFAFIAQMAFRAMLFGGGRSRGGKKDGSVVTLILLAVGIFGYILSIVFKFALSRKREYLADAGAAELTKKPHALANALRKVSKNPRIEAVTRDDVAQMFIEHPIQKEESASLSSMFSGIFATHPPIEKRIKVLEQF